MLCGTPRDSAATGFHARLPQDSENVFANSAELVSQSETRHFRFFEQAIDHLSPRSVPEVDNDRDPNSLHGDSQFAKLVARYTARRQRCKVRALKFGHGTSLTDCRKHVGLSGLELS